MFGCFLFFKDSGSRVLTVWPLPCMESRGRRTEGADHTTSTRRGMKGNDSNQRSRWLGDRGQQGTLSTRKAQAPTALFSLGDSPFSPRPCFQAHCGFPSFVIPLTLHASPHPHLGLLSAYALYQEHSPFQPFSKIQSIKMLFTEDLSWNFF